MSKLNTTNLLKGFRDFLPSEMRARKFVQGKIVNVFERFGFEPLETPTLEYADLLLGKYGQEADKLVYTFEDKGGRKVGLRYDQTVPTARVLANYQSQLPKFFRRYQVQNVFRADKPQKGRYREFTQCDIDIFGSTSPLSDAEILACTYFAYSNVGFSDITLEINYRPSLIANLTPFATDQVNVFSIIQSVDKLDKQTPKEVVGELMAKGLSLQSAKAVLSALDKADLPSELKEIEQLSISLGVPPQALVYNPKLARGLDYYTGLIFEVKSPAFSAGSLGGGGRYDNLIADLSGLKMPATGMAFGFDRTVEAARELGLIKEDNQATQVLVTVFNQNLLSQSLTLAKKLRQSDISCEIYLSPNDRLSKQFKLADQKGIPFVAVIGEKEAKNGTIMMKNMKSGEQKAMDFNSIIDLLNVKSLSNQ